MLHVERWSRNMHYYPWFSCDELRTIFVYMIQYDSLDTQATCRNTELCLQSVQSFVGRGVDPHILGVSEAIAAALTVERLSPR